MSTTAIATELLTLNTRSSDYAEAGGGSGNGIVATTATDGWVISPPSGQEFNERLILRFSADGTGDTVTILAGDRYPAHRVDLGNMTVVLAASDTRYISIETSRFLQNDGTIHATCTDSGTVCLALMLPKAA